MRFLQKYNATIILIMKRLTLLIIAYVCVATGCFDLTRADRSSYVQEYSYYSRVPEILTRSYKWNQSLFVFEVSYDPRSPYYSMFDTGEGRERFDELCALHGDDKYPCSQKYWGWESMMTPIRVLSPDLKTIDLFADKDFDKDHPAGTSLADCVDLMFTSYQDYVDSGYEKDLASGMKRKRLDQVEEYDLLLMRNNYHILFLKAPDDPSAEITYTLLSQNVRGEVQKGTVTCRFPETPIE